MVISHSVIQPLSMWNKKISKPLVVLEIEKTQSVLRYFYM